MKESIIRQTITGIIHGNQEITKESAEYAADKGKEIMEFLNRNGILKKDNTDEEKIKYQDNHIVTYECMDESKTYVNHLIKKRCQVLIHNMPICDIEKIFKIEVIDTRNPKYADKLLVAPQKDTDQLWELDRSKRILIKTEIII